MGSQVVPRFVVLKAFPEATAMYQVELSFGSMATSAIRPERDAGPMPRSFRPDRRSSVMAGVSASWGVATAGSRRAADENEVWC